MKYCEHIAHTLSFNKCDVLPCCTACSYEAPKYYNSKVESLNLIDNVDIDEKQKQMLEILNSDALEQYSCKDCEFLKEKTTEENEETEEDNKKINTIYIRQWHIESYEDEVQFSHPLNYNAYNLLKKLFEQGKFDTENLVIKIQAENNENPDELEGILSIFEQYGFKELHFTTRNTVYKPTIERLIKNNSGSVNIKFIAGTKETYLNIVEKDEFDAIIENTKNYYTNIANPAGICAHYVLIKDKNDNKEEIDKFLSLMSDMKIGSIGLLFDNPDEKNPVLSNYFYQEAEKYCFSIDPSFIIEEESTTEDKPKKKGFFAWLLSLFK